MAASRVCGGKLGPSDKETLNQGEAKKRLFRVLNVVAKIL